MRQVGRIGGRQHNEQNTDQVRQSRQQIGEEDTGKQEIARESQRVQEIAAQGKAERKRIDC